MDRKFLSPTRAVDKASIVYYPWPMQERRFGRLSALTLDGDIGQVGGPTSREEAVATPRGFTQAGLPIGVQLIGRPFEETVSSRWPTATGRYLRHGTDGR